jgi:hypothetical protein
MALTAHYKFTHHISRITFHVSQIMSNTEPTTARLALEYILAYAVWLALLAIAMWLVFVWQSILVTIGLRIGLNPWQLRAVDTWGTFLLGLAWLATCIVTEGYFRSGVRLGVLPRRVGNAFLLLGLAAMCSLLLDWLL